MRNIFLFIRRFFTVIVFLILQAVCIWFLINYNRFHHAQGLAAANEVTGWFNSKYNNVEDFFRMKEENRRLLRLNDSLMNQLPSNFVRIDTGQVVARDSVPFDTLGHYRHYVWRDAQVVYSTVSNEKNYIQINRGSNQGIKDNMGVFSSGGGLVGQVVNVGPNYAQVMSLLHVQNKVNVLVKKTKNSGTLFWDGTDPHFLTLTNIPKSDSLAKGDTIVTGNYSYAFPPGHFVGTIAEIVKDISTNFYVLKIRTGANFANLQQVMVVENLQLGELDQLMQDTRRKIDDAKKPNR
ncbi:rod shape-determining protein MreC [Terrimonas sp. NA20]|uniref:Cell shape-determining protein MreC n=1 Tax=Terrimonas ginsenosidimutans TaxID=2908004 RepID=A0ABS9KQ87_9BACT|nr:rod shape-determining protein MreC [Terrimonas ginsenosidimutans]MCG2614494.1 rod shape-determining protein MreC [Terrimonas ginsenosidimutans]